MAWKSFLTILFSLFLFLHIGCTSSDSEGTDDSEMELAEEEGEDFDDEDGDLASEDLDEEELDEDEVEFDDEEELAEALGDDSEEEIEDFDESEAQDVAEDFQNGEMDTASNDGFMEDSEMSDDLGVDLGDDFEADDGTPLAEEIPQEELTPVDDYAEPPVETAASSEPLETSNDVAAAETPARTWIPVKKIKTEPYQRAGVLVNTVYLARPGDTVASVSQKIFGSDRTQDIYAVNPHLRRGLKPGDKVYYNSPNRSADNSQIIPFAEDVGLQPSFYQTQRGDNIRTVSESLMGYKGAWKEVWAVNPDLNTEEKWALQAGRSLKYWPSLDAAQAQPQLAANEAPSQQDSQFNELAEAPPAQQPDFEAELSNELQEPSSQGGAPDQAGFGDEGTDDIAMNPPEEFGELEEIEDPFADEFTESEDLSSLEAAPQINSVPEVPPANQIARPAKAGGPNDMMMMIAAGALVLVGVGGLVVARKKRAAAAAAENIVLTDEPFETEEFEKTEVG